MIEQQSRTVAAAGPRRGPAFPVPGHTTRAAVVATITSGDELTGGTLDRLPGAVTGLEVRADLAGDLDPGPLRRRFRGELVYTLRSEVYGGRCTDRVDERRRRLLAAARGYDVVELEADQDLDPELLAAIPEHQRRICWYGGPTNLAGLRERFERLVRVPARLRLLAPYADSFESALAPLRLLRLLGRHDVTAFATGTAGGWTRILAPWLGAPVVFGRLAPEPLDDAAGLDGGAPAVGQMLSDYPFPALPPVRCLYGIVGRAFHTSLFLNRLNAAYRKLAMPCLFLPFLVPDATSFRTRFWPAVAAGGTDVLGMPIRGLTVGAPYKDEALRTAEPDAQARRVGAANLLLRRGDRWLATITDGAAALGALGGRGGPWGQPVAVVGCGGAGRATAATLAALGARVTLVNRGEKRGRLAARLLGLPFLSLERFDPGRYALIVHATPAHDTLPFDVDSMPDGSAVIDFVCATGTTPLVAAARRRGLTAVDGREVLIGELSQQFLHTTGRPLPVGLPAAAGPSAAAGRRPDAALVRLR